ncbi:MAG: hypothetical protein AB7V01_17900, partial [Vicinamibacterales bacterium]
GRRVGLIAAALAAVLPGHFLDRTLLGFVDHHALAALGSAAVIAVLAWTLGGARRAPATGSPGFATRAALAGVALGGYLLSWGSGAFLVGVLAGWLALAAMIAREPAAVTRAARATGIMMAVALALVLAFQDPAMYRYGTQVVALAGSLAGAAGLAMLGPWLLARRRASLWLAAALAVALAGAAALAALVAPGLFALVSTDLARFAPSPERMAVLEARPLFLYPGTWDWAQPWRFFRTGFFAGIAGMLALAWTLWRSRDAVHLLVALWAAVCLAATIGQNRFGYYLVPAFALTAAWLAARVLDWGGVPEAGRPAPAPGGHRVPFQREAAVLLVAGGLFAPNLVPAVLTTTRAQRMPAYWRDAMTWLRDSTPPPYPPDYYYARYPAGPLPPPAGTVMNWWDQGYWVTEIARRVPVSNPTQVRAGLAGRFYAETDPAAARALLEQAGARLVLADWEMPFRREPDGTILGHLESIVDWAGQPRARFYDVLWQSRDGGFAPLWVFRPDYYRTMAYRLAVHGGTAVTADGEAAVVQWRRITDGSGAVFREVTDLRRFPLASAAEAFAATLPGADHMVVGLDPWRSPFPSPAVGFLRQVHDVGPASQPSVAPWIRIFAATW